MKSAIIKEMLPFSFRPFFRMLYHLSLDAIDFIRLRRDSLTAPRRISCIGAGDSVKIRREFLGYFQKLGGLAPNHQVLDVGCGTGRMAGALVSYLDSRGSYDGFDIVKPGIDWCVEKIEPRHPNFRFQHADIFNSAYNPLGKIAAAKYVFPYPDASKDFVFLTSVFTHMLPQEMARYLGEIARVMKPGARCLLTFFLLNPESRRLLVAGKSSQNFFYDRRGGLWTTDPLSPETAVAYDEYEVRRLFEKFGLAVQESIHYGSWSGRAEFLSYQDIVVASRL